MFIRTKDVSIDMIGSVIVDAQITDHCMAVIWFQTQMKEESGTKCSYSRIDYNKLNCLLERQEWSNVFISSNINYAYDLFTSTLCERDNERKILQNKKIKVKKLKCW